MQFFSLVLLNRYKAFDQCYISVPPPPGPGCKEDQECPSRQACFSGECENPCTVIRPCAQNAECIVHSTLPLRTMSCVCLPGFTGKGDVRCGKISKIQIRLLDRHFFFCKLRYISRKFY